MLLSGVFPPFNFVCISEEMRYVFYIIWIFCTVLPIGSGMNQGFPIDAKIQKIRVLKNKHVQTALHEAKELYNHSLEATSQQKVMILGLMGSLSKDNLEYDAAKIYYQKLTLLADSIGDMAMKYTGMLGVMDILRHQGKYDSAVFICQQILQEADAERYPGERGMAIKELGDVFRFQGKLDLAYSNYLSAKDLFSEIGDPLLITKADLGLAEVFQLQDKHELAANYYKQVLQIRKQYDNSESVAETYSSVGSAYELIDDQTTAFSYFDSAMQMFERIGNKRGTANAQRKMGKVLRRWEYYDSAENLLKKSEILFESIPDIRQLSKVNRQLGIVYRKQGHFDNSLAHTLRAASLAEGIGFQQGYYKASSDLVKIYEDMGNLEKAYEHQKNLLNTQEMLLSHRFDNKIRAIEASIALESDLSKREKELHELHAISRNRTILLLLVTIGLLALFIAFAYRQYLKDIGRLKKIRNQNETIRSKNKEIALRIEELKQFAYVTSHDLKTPLTGIMKISEWLTRDYRHKLDAQGIELLDLMKIRVHRMENLLNGILSYFKVGSSDLVPERQQLGPLVKEVIESIDTDKQINIEIADAGIDLYADRSQLRQVLHNIIDNSTRYNDRFVVDLKVGIKKQDKDLHLFIQDNGRGIEDRFQQKVFDMFQRIDIENENSTGIGLAIVKRIVEGWNSQIFIKSDPGLGSTVFIRLNQDMIRYNKDFRNSKSLKFA